MSTFVSVNNLSFHRQNTKDYCGAACAMMLLRSIDSSHAHVTQRELYGFLHDSPLHPCEVIPWRSVPDRLAKCLRARAQDQRFALHRLTTREALTESVRGFIEAASIQPLPGERPRYAPIVLVRGYEHWVVAAGYWHEGGELLGFHLYDPAQPEPFQDADKPHMDNDDCFTETIAPIQEEWGAEFACPYYGVTLRFWNDKLIKRIWKPSVWKDQFLLVAAGTEEVPDSDVEIPPRPLSPCERANLDNALLMPATDETPAGMRQAEAWPEIAYVLRDVPDGVLDRAAIQSFATNGIDPFARGADRNDPWNRARQRATVPGEPILVQMLDESEDWYYIVPFVETGSGMTPLIVTVDAFTGDFWELFAAPDGSLMPASQYDRVAALGREGRLGWRSSNESGASYRPFVVEVIEPRRIRLTRLDGGEVRDVTDRQS